MSPHPWLGRWWSALSRSWLEVTAAGGRYVRVLDARGAYDLEADDVRHRIESRLWTREES